MNDSSRPAARWFVYICTAIGTIGPGLLAIQLFADAATDGGSKGGNALRIALGIASLVIALFFLVVGVLYFKSTSEADREAPRG